PDHERWLEADLARSGLLKDRLPGRYDQRYGPGPRQVADLFPAARFSTDQPGPIVLFFHGGFWRALSKDYVRHVAEPLAAQGVATVLPNYDLCPTVPLATVVDQARQALLWTRSQAAALNGDPDRIYVAGNSAGAHLAAMLLAEDWSRHGLARSPIAGAILVTGIYDLNAVLHIQVNEDVRLAQADVPPLSPQFLQVRNPVETIVAVGGDEPPLWIEQSRRFHDKLVRAGAKAELMVLPGLNHFSITASLGDPEQPLTQAMLRLVRP
ncbi:MAG TPA: alpha/beta hydrolase, partial [Dongiaceae bacterium]|nr:alpha/beta hydrolase [Dongiaceae bacterium]